MLALLALSHLMNPQIAAARGVLERTIGPRASEIQLEIAAAPGANDTVTLEAKNGTVRVVGTSGVALCRGFYEYLKNRCNSMVTWEGSNITLPKRWPDQPLSKTTSPVPFRHYYNICTFGYTTAFWDWKRWEREVDWMALHGINMPLAMTGQDKVWQTVFRGYGVPEKSIMAFFSGPAFQPWHWMGNINGHGGPTFQGWLDGQADLQKKILARERELGMKPVVPGFSGFVPVDFDKYVPGVRLDSPTAWAGFQPTKFIDVRDPKFVEVGKKFVEEYRKEFGTDHLYLCDTFNEQNPQFPESTKFADLARAGAAVYEGLRAADPDAVWVMQGWLFYNERDFWHAPEVEALLSRVPEGRMIILDLSGEQYEVWRAQPAVAKKGFIYNTLHNFGQNTGLGGDLQTYFDRAIGSIPNSGEAQNLLGFGLTPEGIDQNPIVYEFMTDAMWQPMLGRSADMEHELGPRVARNWTENDYVRARYGFDSPALRQAWGHIFNVLYKKDAPWYKDGWRSRPGRMRRGRPLAQMQDLEQAVRLLQRAGASNLQLARNPLYQRDLVDVTKTWLGGIADRRAILVSQNLRGGAGSAGPFFQALNDIDAILACRPEHRLSTWIAQAKAWGRTPEQRRLMEYNARLQITAWDGNGVLTDYANKEWAGLTNDFIARRWKLYFDNMAVGKATTPAEYLSLENAWARSTKTPVESRPSDPVTLARALLAKYGGEAERLDSQMGALEPPGNIAKMGVATDDGHTEAGGTPDKAIDGDLDTFWAASPSPCTWQLDLKTPQSIGTVHLFPYWGDGRYYQFLVESSLDGKEWKRIVDASTNTTETTDQGYRYTLAAPLTARYLRVRMLKNSANVGVHLCEVRVYAQK